MAVINVHAIVENFQFYHFFVISLMNGCMVVWRLALSHHSNKASRFESWLGPFCVEFACSKMSTNMHVGLIGNSKLTLGVSVRVHGCLSLCGLVMDWPPVRGLPYLSPNGNWERLQPPP